MQCAGFQRRNRHWNFPQVFSPYWRLYYNFSAGHYVEHEGTRYPLAPGHFLLIPDNVLFHCVSSTKSCDHFYLHFLIQPGHLPRLRMPVAVAADSVSLAMIKKFCRELRLAHSEKVACLGVALVQWLFSQLPATNGPARLPSPSMQKVLEYIETYPEADLSNAALAKAGGVSVRGLIRRCEQELAVSPQAWVRETRLREAARLLARQSASIDEIAERLGFPNRSYFTRRFTGFFKISPAAFRKKWLARSSSRV